MANLELALLLDLVCGAPTGRRLLPQAFAEFKETDRGPDTIILKGAHLDHLRTLYVEGDISLVAALDPLLEKARLASREKPASVLDKAVRHPVGAPHDYVSLAKYWWPVPAEDGTVVYERRDGSVNPACFGAEYDYVRLSKMANNAFNMAIAAYFADDTHVGSAAARMISTWFLNPETAQTPHFSFAQFVPGKKGVTGRGTIEVRYLIQAVEAIRLLHHCGYIDEGQLGELRTWFDRLLDWLMDSEIARKAAKSGNNISVWYWTSSYVFTRFVGDDARAEAILASVADLVKSQVAEDGSLPAEMARYRPHDYTAFSLLGLSLLEAASERQDVDLLTTETEAGHALTAARDWLRSTDEALSIRTSLIALTTETSVPAGSEDIFGSLALVGMLEAARRGWVADREALRRSDADREALTRTAADAERESRALELALAKREADLAAARHEADQSIAKLAKLEGEIRAMSAVADLTSAKLSRLKRQRTYLALPYVVLTAPVSVPLLLWNEKRRKAKRDGTSGSGVFSGSLGAGKASKAKDRNFSLSIKSHKPGRPPAEFYGPSPVDELPDTYVLYRIIGNDLVPRHKLGQSRTNLEFILDHEVELENCEKRFIVNRIFNPQEEERIVSLLEARGQRCTVLPFDAGEYRSVPWDFGVFPDKSFFDSDAFRNLTAEQSARAITAAYRLKNLYIMNNNGARNTALNEGREVAKWVLPWDGNCFVTPRAWADLRRAVEDDPKRRYFAVPMQRITDNAILLQDNFSPDPQEEPQLLFRKDAEESFNPDFPYGRRPKVELFWRLGLPGHWDTWRDDPWELTRRVQSREAGLVGSAGWVARLASGVSELERQRDIGSFKMRGRIRGTAIMTAIDLVDANQTGDPGFPCFYRDAATIEAQKALKENPDSALGLLAADLVARAEAALGDGSFSVIDKTTLPPSGDMHDYWHPAPYWWPNPKTASGLPYIRKDGQRVAGTNMYEPESDKYDRTRLQRMFENTTLCALGAEVSGRQDLAEHGAHLVRRWFLDPASRMNPHLDYAQVRMGHDGNKGNQAGVIEFKDIYFFLDAVRLLARNGALKSGEIEAFAGWLNDYRKWLEGSEQGQAEASSGNNHGTYYDLQAMAIAAFLDDDEAVRTCYFRALSRLERQIEADGKQPAELKRTLSQHYVVFNLQGFLNVFRIAQAYGRPMLGAETGGMDRMAQALHWILSKDHGRWTYKQIEPFSQERLFPLAQSALSLGVVSADDIPESYGAYRYLRVQPVFNPHWAIHPFWNIGALDLA